jgi:hypothetical protein
VTLARRPPPKNQNAAGADFLLTNVRCFTEVRGNDHIVIVSTPGHGIPRDRRRSGQENDEPAKASRRSLLPPDFNGLDATRIKSTKGRGIHTTGSQAIKANGQPARAFPVILPQSFLPCGSPWT